MIAVARGRKRGFPKPSKPSTAPPNPSRTSEPGGTSEPYYVSIAPAIGSPGGNYELSVQIVRKAPAPY